MHVAAGFMPFTRFHQFVGKLLMALYAVVRPNYWTAAVLRTGAGADARIIANTYLPGAWSYSGPNKLIDVQVWVEPAQHAAFAALMKCRLGQAMHLPIGATITVRYDPQNLQRVVFVALVESTSGDSEANTTRLPV